jgi:hypothetical protein
MTSIELGKVLKTPKGLKMLIKHGHLLAEEYDLYYKDIDVHTVLLSLIVYNSTGLIIY